MRKIKCVKDLTFVDQRSMITVYAGQIWDFEVNDLGNVTIRRKGICIFNLPVDLFRDHFAGVTTE